MQKITQTLILIIFILVINIKSNAGHHITLNIKDTCAPYEYVNSNANCDGFIVDIFNAINDINHFDYQIQATPKAFHANITSIDSTDIVTTMHTIPQNDNYIISEPIVYLENNIVTHINSNLNTWGDLHNKKVLVINGSPIISQFHDKDIYPEFVYIENENIEKGLRFLATNKYDALVCSNDVAYYYINKHELPNLLVKPLYSEPIFIRFLMLNTPTNKKIINHINASLVTLRSNGKYDEIFANRFFPDSKDLIQKAELWLFVFVICIILILIAYIIHINRIYKKEKRLLVNRPLDDKILIPNIQKVVESSPTPTILFNTYGEVVFINKAGYNLMNLNKQVRFKFEVHTIFDYTILDSEMVDDLKNNKSIHFTYDLINEIQLFNYLGDYVLPHNRIFDIHIHPTCNYNPTIKGYIAYIYDITDLRNAKYSNIKYLTSLSQISDNNLVDFCYYDAFDNLFYTFSGNKEHSTGASYEKAISLIYPLHRSIFIDEFLSLLNGEKSKANITIKKQPNEEQEYTELNVSLNAIKVDSNTIIGVSIITTLPYELNQHRGINSKELEENLYFIQRNSGYQFFKFDYKNDLFTLNTKDNSTQTYNIENVIEATHPDDRNKVSEILEELKNKQTDKVYFVMRFASKDSKEYNFYEIHMQVPKYDITSSIKNKNYIIGIYRNINTQYSQIHELEVFKDCAIQACEKNQMEYIEYYLEDIDGFIIPESATTKYGINDDNFIDYMSDESKLKINNLIDAMNNHRVELETSQLSILCPNDGAYQTFELQLFPVEDNIKQEIYKYIGFLKKVTP